MFVYVHFYHNISCINANISLLKLVSSLNVTGLSIRKVKLQQPNEHSISVLRTEPLDSSRLPVENAGIAEVFLSLVRDEDGSVGQ